MLAKEDRNRTKERREISLSSVNQNKAHDANKITIERWRFHLRNENAMVKRFINKLKSVSLRRQSEISKERKERTRFLP